MSWLSWFFIATNIIIDYQLLTWRVWWPFFLLSNPCACFRLSDSSFCPDSLIFQRQDSRYTLKSLKLSAEMFKDYCLFFAKTFGSKWITTRILFWSFWSEKNPGTSGWNEWSTILYRSTSFIKSFVSAIFRRVWAGKLLWRMWCRIWCVCQPCQPTRPDYRCRK